MNDHQLLIAIISASSSVITALIARWPRATNRNAPKKPGDPSDPASSDPSVEEEHRTG